MSQAQKTEQPPVPLAELVLRCRKLCRNAEASFDHLPKENGAFLATALSEVLSELELVLRAVGQDPDGPKRSEERRSFLSKLFGREQASEKHAFLAPSFDVRRQGLQGNVETVPIAELLGFLAMSRKTGVLWIDTPTENFMIGLINGGVVHAASDRTPEGLRLGEVLVGLGFLTRRQLERFVEQTKEKNAQFSGDYLVQNGMITADELNQALKQQVQQLVRRAVQAKPGLFRLREGMDLVLEHTVQLDINQLLLESARAADEEANQNLRELAAEHTWSSWQGQLSAEVGSLAGGSPAQDSAAKTDAAPAAPMPAAAPQQAAQAAASGATEPDAKS